MKMMLPLAGAVCAGVLLAAPAAADGGLGAKMMANVLFQAGDTNGNGRLDPDEISAMRTRAFERADANGDGMITRAEQEKAAAHRTRRADMARMMGEQQIDRYDADGDGNISFAEFQAAPRPGFALVDINSDGAIDRSEMDRFVAILANMR
ncbi:MAG: hypothetical protein Kow0026_10590 [Oricola sp.]